MAKKKKKPVRRAKASRANGKIKVKPEYFDWRNFDPAMIEEKGPRSFADELVTYRDRLRELLKNKGKYVLIKGREVVGIFEDRNEALEEAVARIRDAPVLVKKIVAKEPVVYLGGAWF